MGAGSAAQKSDNKQVATFNGHGIPQTKTNLDSLSELGAVSIGTKKGRLRGPSVRSGSMPSISSGSYAAASSLGPVALKPLVISLDMGSPPLVLLDEPQASQIVR